MEAPASTTLVVVGDEATSAIHALEGFANVRDQSTFGVLELEIDRAMEAAERHAMSVPDYYVVLHPETLPITWKHWWLGVLASESPTRVIPWPTGDDSLARLLRHLPTGRAWPDVESWLPRVVGAVPDRVGLPGSA